MNQLNVQQTNSMRRAFRVLHQGLMLASLASLFVFAPLHPKGMVLSSAMPVRPAKVQVQVVPTTNVAIRTEKSLGAIVQN